MRILLLYQYFLDEGDPGGSRWNEMAKMWTDQGNEVTVLCGMMLSNAHEKKPEYKNIFFKVKQQGKITVVRSHVSESYNKGFKGRLWGYFSFMFSSLWAGLFKTGNKYDVLIVTSPPLFVAFTGYILSIFKRIPMVFEIRDLWPESAIETGILTNKIIIKFAYKFEKFIYNRSKLINVLTPAFYNALVHKKHIPAEKIIQIPNAADFTLSEKLLKTFNEKLFRKENDLENRFVITYIGAHGIANDLDQILNAAMLLKDTNVLFLLIGEGMERKRLIEKADALKINNVRFINSVPKTDVFKYILASEMGISVLKKLDVFKTIYSNKTFDYMSCKKPILMAIDGVSRELVEKADCGSYIEPANYDQYVSVIKSYLNKAELLKVKGENGYNFAKLNFDREVLANKYIKYLKDLV